MANWFLEYMARCIDCENLHTRDEEYTTHFCLHLRDYIDDIEEEVARGHFTPLWDSKNRPH
jgi:hypothetical protein